MQTHPDYPTDPILRARPAMRNLPRSTGWRVGPWLGRAWIGVALVFALLAAAVAPAAAQTLKRGGPTGAHDGVLAAVSREVTVVHGTSRSAALVGGPVQTGDRILTGAKSAAALTLRDGTTLALGPDSRMEITQFSFDPKTQRGNLLVTLSRGTLRVTTGRIAKAQPDRFKVVTPTAVIDARNADFIAEQSP